MSVGIAKTQITNPSLGSSGGAASTILVRGSINFYTHKFRGFVKNANSVAVTSQGYYAAGTATQFQGTPPSTQSAPTVAEPGFLTFNSGAGASTNAFGQNEQFANPAPQSFNRFVRLDFRFAPAALTGAFRYWFGIYDNAAGALTLPGLGMASDAPNGKIIGFRLSGGIDVNFKAISQTSAILQSIIDTLIAPVAGTSHLFTITYDGNATLKFFIDNVQVGQTTSNLLAAGDSYYMFFCCDNKNTANNASFNMACALAYDTL